MTHDRYTSRTIADGTVDRTNAPHASVEAHTPSTGPFGVLTAAYEAAQGALKDRAILWRLRRESDRVLADMGLERHTMAESLKAARKAAAARRGALISQRRAAWREESRVYGELSRCTDAELEDIGLHRSNIRSVARDHAVLLFRDDGLVDSYLSTDVEQVAANKAASRRAA